MWKKTYTKCSSHGGIKFRLVIYKFTAISVLSFKFNFFADKTIDWLESWQIKSCLTSHYIYHFSWKISLGELWKFKRKICQEKFCVFCEVFESFCVTVHEWKMKQQIKCDKWVGKLAVNNSGVKRKGRENDEWKFYENKRNIMKFNV